MSISLQQFMASPTLPAPLLQWLHRVLAIYSDPQRTYSDVVALLLTYPSLSPRTEVLTDEIGNSELLLNIYGTLPTTFRGSTYNFPVSIWIPRPYPKSPPTIFVTASSGMLISPGNHVDLSGRCYHPYLANWVNNIERSNLVDLCEVFKGVFAREAPVYSKLAAVKEQLRPGTSPGHPSPPPPPKPPKPNANPESKSHAPQPPPLPPVPEQLRQQNPRLVSRLLPPAAPMTTQSQSHHPSAYHQQFSSFPRGDHQVRQQFSERPGFQAENINVQISPTAKNEPLPQAQISHQPISIHGPQSVQHGDFGVLHSNNTQAFRSSVSESSVKNALDRAQETSNLTPARRAPAHDLLDAPNSSSPASPSSINPPRPPPNPEKDRSLKEISTKLSRLAHETLEQNSQRLNIASSQADAILKAEKKLEAETTALKRIQEDCSVDMNLLSERVRMAEKVISDAKSRPLPDVDALLAATSTVHNQLYELICDDKAIQDCIYLLGKLLDRSRGKAGQLEQITWQVRKLAREQFLIRATVRKIRDLIGLQ